MSLEAGLDPFDWASVPASRALRVLDRAYVDFVGLQFQGRRTRAVKSKWATIVQF